MIYKNWSFRLFIYYIILNIAMFIIALQAPIAFHISIGKVEKTNLSSDQNVLILSAMAFISLILGIIFTIISIIKNEPKDYKLYNSVIGFGIIILGVLTMLIL